MLYYILHVHVRDNLTPMKRKRIFILTGHPGANRLTTHLADAYETGAKEAGHQVRRMDLCALNFDPILHKGYSEIQPLEPDLLRAQEEIKAAEHFVILYPTWFSTMPALLVGFFDRIWLPHFAFYFKHSGFGWERLLKGRSATVFVISDTMPLFLRLVYGDTTNEIKKGILWFAGFSPVRIKKIGPVKHISAAAVKKLWYRLVRYGRWAY